MIEESSEKVACQYCGAEIPSGAVFCPRCGRKPEQVEDEKRTQVLQPPQPVPVEDKTRTQVLQPPQSAPQLLPTDQTGVCSYCGQPLIPNTPYCWSCGRPVNGASRDASPAPTTEPLIAVPLTQPRQDIARPAPHIAQPASLPGVKSTWQYPILKIFQILLRVFGVMTIVFGLGGGILLLVASAQIARSLSQYNPQIYSAVGGGNILMFLGICVLVILLALPMFAAAEFIQMFMDIEINQRIQTALLQRGWPR